MMLTTVIPARAGVSDRLYTFATATAMEGEGMPVLKTKTERRVFPVKFRWIPDYS